MALVSWSLLVSRGAEVGAGAGLPPRGLLFSSIRLTNFLTFAPGTAFRFTGGAAAAVSDWTFSKDLPSLWEWNESFRSSSLFEGLCPIVAACTSFRLMERSGGGGGNSLLSRMIEDGIAFTGG